MVRACAQKYSGRTVFHHKESVAGEWIATTWQQFADQVSNIAKALASLGVEEQENIATYTQNKPEGLIADFAAYANRAVIVPLYATSSLSQIEYIINEAETRFIFVGEQFQYDNAFEAQQHCPTLKQIIIFDPAVKRAEGDTTSILFSELMEMGAKADTQAIVDERTARVKEDDLANIIYTSGTTGEPKGVMLDHSNFMTALRIHCKRLTSLSSKDTSLCFLPMAHIFERAWTYYCFYMGITVYINLDPKAIQQVIKEVRPTLMCSVPRFWEKVYSAVQDTFSAAKGAKALLIKRALKVGKTYNIDYKRREVKAPFWVALEYKLYDKLVFEKMKRAVGIEQGNIFPVAGAALSDNITQFFRSCGINITYGYGLTETTATVTCFEETYYKIGTVGTTMPGVQVKLGENNEILIKGDTVMKGYYKKPAESAKVFTQDGWFRSGDAGKLSPNGDLILTERIKDLFKTSNGKYIAPQAIETVVSEDRFIDQIAVIGNGRKYVTAIVIPAFEALKEYAAQKHISYHNLEELVKHHKIEALIQERVNELQKNFAKFEQIKKITLLPRAFTLEGGELTNTLKLRRAIINQMYSVQIEAMYV